MRTTGWWWCVGALGLSGCVVAIPPPAAIGGRSAVVGATGSAVSAGVALGTEPAGAVSLVQSAGANVAVEARGQLTDGSVSADPGVWLRGPLGAGRRAWAGARLGGVAGTGALGPELAYDNVYVGPTAHVQYAHRYGDEGNPGLVAVTTGLEYEVPLMEDVRKPDGQVEIARVAAAWIPVDLRLEAPVGGRGALTVSAGGSWRLGTRLASGIVPHVAFGARFPLGAGGGAQ